MPVVDPTPADTMTPLTRLPGRAARIRVDGTPGGTLWLGVHHLLQVQSGVLREGYRRFAYRDIQSIGVRRTVRGVVYNVTLGGVIALFGLIVAALIVRLTTGPAGSRDSLLGAVFILGVIAAGFVALLLTNVFRGPTVRCDLRTAVGLYPLPSLSRMRPARRALELIRQRVEAAQGALSPEALAERVARLAPSPPPPATVPVPPTPDAAFAPAAAPAEVNPNASGI